MATTRKSLKVTRAGSVRSTPPESIRSNIVAPAAKSSPAIEFKMVYGDWHAVYRSKDATKQFFLKLGEAVHGAISKLDGGLLSIRALPKGKTWKFEVIDRNAAEAQSVTGHFDEEMAAARQRGQTLVAEILSGRDMLSAGDFGKNLGLSRQAVLDKRRRHEVLGLEGPKRGVRFPNWQIVGDGHLLPGLPEVFKAVGEDSWAVYRFLKERHPELEGHTALDELRAGRIGPVLSAAANADQAFS